jgi:hypothetical protein
MRYLYGDSHPFPLDYDFLSALETFMANAPRAALLDAEIRAAQKVASDAQGERERTIGELEAFHIATLGTVEQSLPPKAHAPTIDYVRKTAEYAAHVVEELKGVSHQAAEQEKHHLRSEVDRRRTEIRAAIEAFLAVARLPVEKVAISMRLHEGKNELSATLTHPEAIVSSFTLASGQEWHSPRKVGEFTQGVELPAGVKRGWFQRGVQHEMMHIDDMFIGGLELREDSAEIRLRKKPLEKDSLVFIVRAASGGVAAEMHHPEDTEAESLPGALDVGATAQVERLWRALREGCAPALVRKERLLSARVDGHDIVDRDRAVPLISAVVKLFVPIVEEIMKRSPNAAELSLKAEDDAGRREEIYVKKSHLLKDLEPLAGDERKLFAPLGLGTPPKRLPTVQINGHPFTDEESRETIPTAR